MGPLEQLHFEVILDHAKFDKEIEALKKSARELNTEVSNILDLRKNLNKQTVDNAKTEEQIARQRQKTEQMYQREIEKTNREKQKTAELINREKQKTEALIDREIKKTEKLNTTLGNTRSLVSSIAQLTGVYLGVAGVRRFVSSLVEVTGQFEVQKMALTSMLQSADKADEIFNRLRQNALESPYTFAELTAYAKQLTAFNIPVDKLVDTEKMLADVAAAVGVDMSRIILAYGQVKAAGALKGQELRQFTEAGVPILDELAKQIEETEGKAISLSAVFDRISKKQIPFEMVEEAFRRMTSEGGKFYNMQEVLVETLQGRIGKLRDVWQQALYDLGTSNDGVLKGTVDLLTALAGHLETIVKVLTPVISAFGAYYGALMLAAVGEKAVAGVNLFSALLKAATGSKAAASALTFMGVSAKAAALGLVAVAAVVGVELYRALNKSNRELEEYQKHLDEIHKSTRDAAGMDEVNKLENLKKIAEDTNRTYDERLWAIKQLNAVVPSYHAGLSDEGKLINANVKSLDNYIAKLRQAAQEKGAQDELSQLYNEQRTQNRVVKEAQERLEQAENRAKNTTTTYYGTTGAGDMQGALAYQRVLAERQALADAQAILQKINGRIVSVEQELQQFGLNIMGWGNDWDGNSIFGTPKSDEEKAAEAKIEYLRKLKDAFDKLSPYMGEDGAIQAIQGIFNTDGVDLNNLDAALTGAIDELAALGGDAATNAEKIRASLGLDEVSLIERAFRKYQTIRAKFEKDWGIGGEGFDYDMDKIASDFANEQAKIDKDYEDGLAAIAEAHKGNAAAIESETASLKSLYEARSQANRAAAQNKIDGLVSKYVRDKTSKLDLRDWGDKSIGQVRAIYNTLSMLATSDVIIDKELKEKLDKAELSIEDFSKLTQEEFEQLSDKAQEELKKKVGATIKELAGDFSSVADSLLEFAEASKNAGLAQFASNIKEMMDTFGTVASRFSQGDVIGGIVASLTAFVNKIFEAATGMAQLNARIAEISEQSRRSALSDMLAAAGVFGVDSLGQLRSARGIMAYTIADMQNKASMKNITTYQNYVKEMKSVLGAMADLGLAAYDENGILNRDSLEVLLEVFPEMDAWINILIDDVDAYYEALESIEGVMSDIIGDIADQAADNMIDRWLEMGDAALDYADILDDVARSYAKMVVKSMIMEAMDENLVKELATLAMDGKSEEFMATLANAMEGIKELTPYINDVMNAVSPYLTATGTEGNSLASGIKSITEETASLLASYVNNIRGDLSAMRVLQETGWKQVDVVANSMPTLNDYIQQIAANTASSAQATNEILEALNDVIGSSGSDGQLIRVQIS